MPENWATSDTIQQFSQLSQSDAIFTGARTISINTSGDLALFGGSDGKAGIFDLSRNRTTEEFSLEAPVTYTLWAGSKAAIGTSSGIVKIFENGVPVSSFAGHAGPVSALALHPSGEILASVGEDKSYIFYDLMSAEQIFQISTDSGIICSTGISNRKKLLIAA